jgi:site-specific recombinase XerD
VIESSTDPEIIFTTQSANRVLSRGLSGQLMQRKIKQAGLPSLSFHGLRHTFASWYMVEVGAIWSLMQTLGHSSIKTTMRYAHVSSKHQTLPNFNWDESSPLVSLSEKRSMSASC